MKLGMRPKVKTKMLLRTQKMSKTPMKLTKVGKGQLVEKKTRVETSAFEKRSSTA